MKLIHCVGSYYLHFESSENKPVKNIESAALLNYGWTSDVAEWNLQVVVIALRKIVITQTAESLELEDIFRFQI